MKKESTLKKLTGSREFLLAVILVVAFLLIGTQSSSWLSLKNISDIIKNNSVTMIMSLGMLCVLLIGGIDISIMSTAALSGMSIGLLMKYDIIRNTPLLFLIAIAIGTACGLLIGVIIAKGNVLPIIATMGFMYIYRGATYVLSKNQWASADDLGDFKNFALGSILGINNVIWVAILCAVIFFVVLKWTTIGRRVYAVGSNPSAAEVSGINVARVKIGVYTVMGFLAGLGGALTVSLYGSGQPNMLDGGEMDVIAACVIGGISMNGGRGSVAGALLGASILGVIAKALPMVGIDSIAQNAIKGALILAFIIINVVSQRIVDKNNLKGREM
ncbi:MAG: ABC transporter permease [Eubacterium sp.]|nr:ABC transporter permease [Eubacterium sp.]